MKDEAEDEDEDDYEGDEPDAAQRATAM